MRRKSNAKKKNENYDSHLPRTRCTSSERAAIDARAAQVGLTPSEYMRRISLSGKIIIKQSKHDPTIIRQLSAIGNNINQYIKRSHIRGLNAQEHDLLFGCFKKLDGLLTGLIDDTKN